MTFRACYWALFLFLFSGRCFAQSAPGWPRQDKTGRVELTGVLPWPTPLPLPEQQRALVRGWYTAKLTSAGPGTVTAWGQEEATYAGLPVRAYLDSTASAADDHHLRLLYRVHLSAGAEGLEYRLSEFECVELGFDYMNKTTLEDVLTALLQQPDEVARMQRHILARFRHRLQKTLSTW